MSTVPSPPPDASGTARGLVNLLAQTFAGIKSFTSKIIAAAGIELTSAIWTTNGTGSSDVGPIVGVSTADASVHASAKIASWGTGIGGTYVERMFLRKSEFGHLTNVTIPTGFAMYFGGAVSVGPYLYSPSTGQLELGVSNSTVVTLTATNTAMVGDLQLNTAGNARPTANAGNRGRVWYSKSANGSADTLQVCLKSAADTYSWVTIATG